MTTAQHVMFRLGSAILALSVLHVAANAQQQANNAQAEVFRVIGEKTVSVIALSVENQMLRSQVESLKAELVAAQAAKTPAPEQPPK